MRREPHVRFCERAVVKFRRANLPGESTIKLAVMATVLISIFAHGLSAAPGIKLYAGKIAGLGADAPEHQEVKA